MALLCCWIYPLATPADAAAKSPTHIVWPDGWRVTATPLPAILNKPGKLGESWEALKTDAATGEGVAEISFVRLAVITGDDSELHAKFLNVQQSYRQGYLARSLQLDCDNGKPGTLDTLPSLASTCDVHNGAKLVARQLMVTAIGNGYVYNLLYTAPASSYANYLHDFESVRASIRIDDKP
ncbi:DUF4946 domain-containing protein [Dyella silvatica]|uniref:DUF4946 domain-containing protein n=1 Tax=Dyella silvatica TaxID=2992128 RepID=UPI00224D65EE|nr:DUF4946 domain-containing protein [Dyella silvatica]